MPYPWDARAAKYWQVNEPVSYTHLDVYKRQLWEDFEQGHPSRTPVILGINPRYYLGLPEVNVHGISFKEYTEDPAVMMDYQCRCEEYRRLYIPFDEEKGLPEFWSPYVDWQNFYDCLLYTSRCV